jgi:hypothetical protein
VAGKKMGPHSDDSEEDEEIDLQDCDGQISSLTILDFISANYKNEIVCPEGQKAIIGNTKKEEGLKAIFNRETCNGCPRKNVCPVKVQKRTATLIFNDKDVRLAERRRREDEPEYKSVYKLRSGIEASNSQLSNKFNIKRLSVRGLRQVDVKGRLKCLALNIVRAAKYEHNKKQKDRRNMLAQKPIAKYSISP